MVRPPQWERTRFVDHLSMQDTADRIATYQLHATPLAGTTTVEWRSPQSGRLVAVTEAAPRGRKGLWDAMARAAAASVQPVTSYPTEAALAVEPIEVLPAPQLTLADASIGASDEPAHLGYLARLAEPGERNDATGQVAPVVSLADYAARRQARR
jgi:hypothetical protein